MNNETSNNLQKFYLAYFGRPADPGGINYWLTCLNDSLTMKDISVELSKQEEYKHLSLD